MKTLNKLKTFLLLILLLVFADNFAQRNKDCLPKPDVPKNDSSIFHKTGSNYPDTIHVIGQVVGITNPICDYVNLKGSLKVKLTTEINLYNYPYVYLITGCTTVGALCKKSIDVRALKLVDNDINREKYGSLKNKFDKNVIPYYIIVDKDLEKLQ